MFPLSADKLSLLEIADYWSRFSNASKSELLAELEAAWWLGKITGNSALNRLQFLKKMFRSRREPYMQSVVFASPSDAGEPTEIPLPDGGVVVRPKIIVPDEADDWTEHSCADAFEALANLPSKEYFPQLSYSICFIDLTREEFFEWILARGFDVPTFWKTTGPPSGREVAPKREGSGKEERKPTATPLHKGTIEAAYKQRINTYLEKKPPSRTDDEKWVNEEFGLGVTKARDLRRNLAPPDWRKSGRRKD